MTWLAPAAAIPSYPAGVSTPAHQCRLPQAPTTGSASSCVPLPLSACQSSCSCGRRERPTLHTAMCSLRLAPGGCSWSLHLHGCPQTQPTQAAANAPIFFVIVSGGPGTLRLAEPVLQALPPITAAPVVQLAPPAGAVPRAFFCLNANHVFETDNGVSVRPGSAAACMRAVKRSSTLA